MTWLEKEPLTEILYTDTNNHYMIESINPHFVRVCDQVLSIEELCKKAITIDYHHSWMSGFHFRTQSHQLQYRWFKIHTISNDLNCGKWYNLFKVINYHTN